jgi:hypothetical protein
MANPSYESLLRLASSYMPIEKASEILKRQLGKLNLNAATLSGDDVRNAAPRLSIALGLYVTDDVQREELKKRMSSF